jgi:hypothetical protein
MNASTPLRPALALAALVATAACGAAALPGTCRDGSCTANVDEKLAAAPCAGAPILLAWRQAGGAVLIQCETADADMDKPSFVFDRRAPGGPAYELTGMRFFQASALPELAGGGAPDTFAAHALCRRPEPPLAAPGELLLGEKVPADDPKNPYCYRLLRVSTQAGGITIRADDGDAPKASPTHAGWDRLAAKMSALIPAHAEAAARQDAVVRHAKAPLRDAPDLAAAPHGYLVQGDAVAIVDRARSADGWLKVRYVGRSGSAIERWARADDLDVAAAAAR